MRTSSMGLLPAVLSPSTVMMWPLVATASKHCFSFQVALALVINLASIGILPAVIGAGFRVNQHAKEFGSGLLEADFEVGLDVVDAGEGKIVGEGAVAGDVKAAADFFDLDVVHVEDFGEFGGEG